jgi:RNA polymerase primary sigma factor
VNRRDRFTAVLPDEDVALREKSEHDGDEEIQEETHYSVDGVRAYLIEIGRVPLLSHPEEIELARRLEQGVVASARLESEGDSLNERDARALRRVVEDGALAKASLIEANLRLVVSVAKRYSARGLAFMDLVQEGNVGLVRAVEKFDHRRGFRFSTYATWWIRQSITRALGDHNRVIRIPIHMVESLARLRRAQGELRTELGRDASEEEIAARLGGLSVAKVRAMISYLPDVRSLDVPVGEGEESPLMEFIDGNEEDTPAAHVEVSALASELEKAVGALPHREAQVLRLRYGIGGAREHTLEEVGKAIGVTRERARQIEARAIRKLRYSIGKERDLDVFL